MKKNQLYAHLACLLALTPYSLATGAPKNTAEVKPLSKYVYENQFEHRQSVKDPVNPSNGCFRIGTLDIPVKGLPAEKKLKLTFRVLSQAGPGRLQLDIIDKRGSRGITQCSFPGGQAWTTASLTFSIHETTAELSLYDKWTDNPIFIDDIQIEVIDEKVKK